MNFPWRTALFISLALNLVVVSAAIGAFASGARLERPAPEGQEEQEAQFNQRLAGQRAFMQALPPETRRALRRELGEEIMAMREERAAARQTRLDLYDATRAEPYDAARVRTAFAAVRAADAVLLEAFHNALADGFGRIDAADRAAALEALAQQQPRGDRPSALGERLQREGPPGEGAGDGTLRRERRERIRERIRERREQQAP